MKLNRRDAYKFIGFSALLAPFFSNKILANAQQLKTLNQSLNGNLKPVHDPCIIEENGIFHLFSTSNAGESPGFIHWRTSTDLREWKFKGAVFPEFPAWVKSELQKTQGMWAPEIIHTNGAFRIYYSLSVFGQNTSIIAMASTPTLDTSNPSFGWKDEGIVYRSNQRDDFNAIDPNVFIDTDNKQYLSFGSFWTGIKLIEIDPLTGKPYDINAKLVSLARRRFPGAIEAPTIIKRGDFYYLFASFDFCCQGANSTYFMGVGRSNNIKGPYIDRDGLKMMNEGGTIVLHSVQDKTNRFKGPGGGSILKIKDREVLVYHAYDANDKGAPNLRLSVIQWTQDGWPLASL